MVEKCVLRIFAKWVWGCLNNRCPSVKIFLDKHPSFGLTLIRRILCGAYITVLVSVVHSLVAATNLHTARTQRAPVTNYRDPCHKADKLISPLATLTILAVWIHG